MDFLDTIPNSLGLPDDPNDSELILKIKDIGFFTCGQIRAHYSPCTKKLVP